MKNFELDGVKYSLDDMSEDARRNVKNIQVIQQQLIEKKKVLALLARAKQAYTSDIKLEMLSEKTGLDLSNI